MIRLMMAFMPLLCIGCSSGTIMPPPKAGTATGSGKEPLALVVHAPKENPDPDVEAIESALTAETNKRQEAFVQRIRASRVRAEAEIRKLDRANLDLDALSKQLSRLLKSKLAGKFIAFCVLEKFMNDRPEEFLDSFEFGLPKTLDPKEAIFTSVDVERNVVKIHSFIIVKLQTQCIEKDSTLHSATQKRLEIEVLKTKDSEEHRIHIFGEMDRQGNIPSGSFRIKIDDPAGPDEPQPLADRIREFLEKKLDRFKE